MKNKQTVAALQQANLLQNLEFILHLKFETNYAMAVRGGHAPVYLAQRRRRQLVHNSSLLQERERRQTAHTFLFTLN